MSLKGFSIIELSIAMAVAAILATAIVPISIRSFQLKAAEKTIGEVQMIQEAARNYYADHTSWPLSLDILKEQGYLDENWQTRNPWQYPYEIASDNLTFSVSTDLPQEWTSMLAGRLSSSVISEGRVSSTIVALRNAVIASGVIVAWSGLIKDIPHGWILCDGQNSTPDLRDKFIVGARQDEGGQSKTAISGALLKEGGSIRHEHGGLTAGHVLTSRELPPIQFSIPAFSPNQGGAGNAFQRGQDPADGSIVITSNGKSEAHAHGIAEDEHIPPFYALAFIMKL